MIQIFQSKRYFILHDYFPSHRQLLIRSFGNDEMENIDIIIFDVSYIQGLTSFKGIKISNIDNDQLKTKFGISNKESKVFKLESEDNKLSYVVGESIRIFKNNLHFNETSLGLYKPKGREKEIKP